MTMCPSVLLIFGTSHVGKSTLATRVGEALGWRVASTDQLARHPGRPWPEPRPPVAEFYSRLTNETIHWFLRVHHENMWPFLEQQITEACREKKGFILEGAALRPEFIAKLNRPDILAIGLHADEAFLRKRMEIESSYLEQDADSRSCTDKFIARSLRDNDSIVERANQLGLRLVNVGQRGNFEQLADELVAGLTSRQQSQ